MTERVLVPIRCSPTGGMLCWPKHMSVSALHLQLTQELDPKVLRELSIQFQVGEKIEVELPLVHMERNGLQWIHTLKNPVHIPRVQNFVVFLNTDKNYLGEIEMRATLIGDLQEFD